MCPDTNLITPQSREGPSTDQHRWQQFAVLPDRWKNNAFGGAGMACMLYVDWNDRRGNEGRFVAIADSICLTSSAKFGAHNGWHAPGNVNIDGLDVRTNMSVAVSNKNSQPGTTWDLYQVKSSESVTTSGGQLGSRLANRANMGFAAGRESRQGPTPEMLRAYYRMVAILAGDLDTGILGPFVNHSQNDIAILSDFLTAADGLPRPRGLFIQGDGFGQSEKATGGIDPQHIDVPDRQAGVVFRSTTYQGCRETSNDCADLLTTTAAHRQRGRLRRHEPVLVLERRLHTATRPSRSAGGAFYENVGLNGPYVSDVVKTAVPLRNWVRSRAATTSTPVRPLLRYDAGRRAYYYYMLNKVFGGICQITGAAKPHARHAAGWPCVTPTS
jgi:hypothetical protein